jgi:general secretion pathway protein L
MAGARGRLRDVAGLGLGFLRWWRGELAALVPGRLRRRREARPDVIVDLAGGTATLHRPTRAGLVEIGRVTVREGEDGRAEVAALIGHRRGGRRGGLRRAALRLGRGQALRRQVELPAAARESLRETLGYELDRITPLPAEELYFDHRLLGLDEAGQMLTVELAAAERRKVEAARRLLEGWGLSVERVGLDPGTGDEAMVFDLGAAEPGSGLGRGSRRATLLLSSLAAALLAAIAVLPLAGKRADAEALGESAERGRRAVAELERIRLETEGIVARASFVPDRKAARPAAVEVLLEVTRVVPDGSWLSQLRISGPELRIAGFSPAASALLERVEASPLFRAARFQSPTTRDAQAAVERFEILAEIVERPSP